MSNRFHQKWHRHNHHTSTNPSIEPDAGHDPIASHLDTFKGDFVINPDGSALSARDIRTNTISPFSGLIMDIEQPFVLRVSMLSAISATVNYQNILVSEISGFVVSGDDSTDSFHDIMYEGANNLALKLIPVSSTSWATFDKDLRTKRNFYVDGIADVGDLSVTGCLSTDCIRPYTAGSTISAHGNIDLMGNSISGIGDNSLSFQNGITISTENLYNQPLWPIMVVKANNTTSEPVCAVTMSLRGPISGTIYSGAVFEVGAFSDYTSGNNNHIGSFGNINNMLGGDTGTQDIGLIAIHDNLLIGTHGINKHITFHTADGGWSQPKMIITSGGNIGMGVLAPVALLETVSHTNTMSTDNVYHQWNKALVNLNSSVSGFGLWGVNSIIYYTGTKNISSTWGLIGEQGTVINQASGDISQAAGVVGAIANDSIGKINTGAAILAMSPGSWSGGTIDGAYGVYIEPQSQPNIISAYSIYQPGASDINYFNGNVGISTETPSEKLTVSGNISTTGAISASNGNSNQWNSVYATVCTTSAYWDSNFSDEIVTLNQVSAYGGVITVSGNMTLADSLSTVTFTNTVCSTLTSPVSSEWLIVKVNGANRAVLLYNYTP